MSELLEKRGNKVIIHVNVYATKDCPAFETNEGYVAVAEEMTCCWALGDTIDAAIKNFKDQYAGMLTMQFKNGEQFEFDFAVKIKF